MIDLHTTLMQGERCAADAEWGELCSELKSQLSTAREDLKVNGRHASRSCRLGRQLDAQAATLATTKSARDELTKEVALLKGRLRNRDNRMQPSRAGRRRAATTRCSRTQRLAIEAKLTRL